MQNIFVVSHNRDQEPHIKIGDFGISKRAFDGLEAKGIRYCTSGYTAPEILRDPKPSFDEIYSPKVDLWSLGCVVFRMLAKENLFSSNYDIKQNADTRIASLQNWQGATDKAVSLLQKLLCKNPDNRCNSADALGDGWLEPARGY